MKKKFLIGSSLALSLFLMGCSNGTAGSSNDTNSQAEEKKPEEKKEKAVAEMTHSTSAAWKAYSESEYTDIHAAAIYENKGDVPVKIGETQLNHKAKDGSILGTESMVYAVPRVIKPGETAIIANTSAIEGINSEDFKETTYNFSFDKTDEDPNLLEVSGVKGIATEDSYRVTGVVKNITKEQQDDIRLAAVLFDKDGNLLAGLTNSVDVGVASGSEAGFELSYPEVPPSIINKVEKIEVKAYGWNW